MARSPGLKVPLVWDGAQLLLGLSRPGHRLVPTLQHLDEHAHRLLLGGVALGLVEQHEVVERGDVVRVRVAQALLVDAARALEELLRPLELPVGLRLGLGLGSGLGLGLGLRFLGLGLGLGLRLGLGLPARRCPRR